MTRARILNLAALFTTMTAMASANGIQFIGVPTGVNDGNYYVLPYEVTIDGRPQLVACYDIYDDVNFGDTWQAQLLDLNTASTSGYFSSRPDALAKYERVAWLDAQQYHTSDEQIGLQYAIWDVFGTYRTTTQSLAYEAAANAAAASAYAGFDFSGVRFIEQIGGVSGQAGTRQALMYWGPNPGVATSFAETSVPEPGTALLSLLAGMFIAGVGVRRFGKP
jgi:hypothetical protein